MTRHYLDIAFSPSVRAAQRDNGSTRFADLDGAALPPDRLGPDEVAFVAARDSFLMATVSETGWPYVQHRGGPAGFLRVLDAHTLGFVDFRGNRQYVSLGNLAANDRAALFLLDHARRARLKIYARVAVRDLAADPATAEALALPGYRARAERALILSVEAFDWNCAQHIMPRLSETEMLAALEPVRRHVTALEAENAALRARLGLAVDEAVPVG
jgi:uncharacterized protein